MSRFIVAGPHFIAGETLIVPQVGPLPDPAEVATRMLAVAVEIVHALALKILRRERGKVTLAHDLLADVVDAVACIG